MHSFLHDTVSVTALLQCRMQRHLCFSQRRYCLIYGPDTEDICRCMQADLFHYSAFFLQTSLASNNMNNVMVIYWYYWCASQKEMKRFVLIRVPPTVSWWWCWNEPRNQRIHQPHWTVLRYSRYKGFTSQGYGENQTQRPLYMLHDEEDLPSLRSQRPVGHTNGRAI